VSANVNERLVFRDVEGQFIPALATAWNQVDSTTWHLQLREGVRWHDGTPFTAQDVKFTFDRVSKDPAQYWHDRFAVIEDTEVVNDYEILIHTTGPDPILINRLAGTGAGIAPQHYVETVGWEEFARNPIGTGPFKFVEWIHDQRIVLEANNDYWGGRPAFDRIVFRVIPESSTQVAELISGGVQLIESVPPQDVDRVNASGVARTVPQATNRVYTLVFNTDKSVATGDQRIREAVDYAIDNQLLIDALFGGQGTPTRARITPSVSFAPMELYDSYLYDPERSRQLLADAGYAPGELRIKLQAPSGPYPLMGEMAELIGAMLEQAGFSVSLEILEWSAFNNLVWNANKVVNIALNAFGSTILDGWFPLSAYTCDGTYSGKTKWCNAEYDSLVNGGELETDVELRREMLYKAFDILVTERPIVGLHQMYKQVGLSNQIDWAPRADEVLWLYTATPTKP